ncbi:MAG: hypothetical protein ACRCSP_08285 [Rhodoglobus sp.]
MDSRWARFVRGWIAAEFATFVAAVSHGLAGGSAPSLFALMATLLLSATICTVLAGRRLSLRRLTASVALSQSLFHAVFSGLGTPHITSHQHDRSLALATEISMAHAHTGQMWLAHCAAGIITVVVFRYAETTFWGLAGTARIFMARLLATRIAVPFIVARAHSVSTGRFTPQKLTDLLSTMRHRGPPKALGVA